MVVGIFFLAISCGGQQENTTEQSTTDAPAEKKCTYSLKADELRVAWVAYKFTEKVGVNGKFDSISVKTSVEYADEPKKLLENLEVLVNMNNINTYDNEERDGKIKAQFFGNIKGDAIFGQVKSITDDKMTISFNMNEIQKEVELNYEVSEDEITANGEINVNDWQGGEGIKALNEKCEELHKGTDGISILHPEVKISFSVPITKKCE